jgi:hypothetical protein
MDSAVDLHTTLLPQEQLVQQFNRARDAVHRLVTLVQGTLPHAPSWEFQVTTCPHKGTVQELDLHPQGGSKDDESQQDVRDLDNTTHLLEYLHQHVDQPDVQVALVRLQERIERLRHDSQQWKEYIAFMSWAPRFTTPVSLSCLPPHQGSLYAMGQNDDGQCGVESATWTYVGDYDHVVCGSMCTVALKQGRVFVWGSEEITGGQGIQSWDLPPMEKVACTESAMAFLTSQGRLYQMGFFRVRVG